MQEPALRWLDRIATRLLQAESREPDAHYRSDYRIARVTLGCIARGWRQPHVAATYKVIGLHPAKVWPAIVARRKAQLGCWYETFFGENLPPKKLPQSVRLPLGAFGGRPGEGWRSPKKITAPDRQSSAA